MIDLQLHKTTYLVRMPGDVNTVQLILETLQDKYFAEIDYVGERVYQKQITDPRSLLKDDLDLLKDLGVFFSNDPERWLNASVCSKIAQDLGNAEICGRKSEFVFNLEEVEYRLAITTLEGNTFKLNFSNSQNSDILTCSVIGNDIKELETRISNYADMVAYLASMFVHKSDVLFGNTFTVSNFINTK